MPTWAAKETSHGSSGWFKDVGCGEHTMLCQSARGVMHVVVLAVMFVVGKKKGKKSRRTRAQKGQRGDGVRVAGARGGHNIVVGVAGKMAIKNGAAG